MKNLLQIYNGICTKYINHDKCIDTLFSFLTSNPNIQDSVDNFLYKNLQINDSLDLIATIQLIGIAHQKKKENKKIAQTNERKHFGIYYTDYSIAKLITQTILQNIDNKKDFLDKKFLEPCVGGGIFIIAYLDSIFETYADITKTEAQKILNNIFVADIDIEAIMLVKKIIPAYIKYKYHFNLSVKDNNFYAGDLLFKKENSVITKNDPKIIFNVLDGFDFVATNPPYKLLKANSNKYGENNLNKYADQIRHLVNQIKSNKFYKYNEGTLNYYKIFVEEILENYTHKNSGVGLLIPSTILNDKQSESLRKRILSNYFIHKIYIIPEKNSFFPDITQAFCFFALDKSTKGKHLTIQPTVKNEDDFRNKGVTISINSINQLSNSSSIVSEDKDGWKILNKINQHPRLKSITNIKNLRGELDLTLDKNFILENETSYPLLRGVNIGEFDFKLGKLFVDEKFIHKLNGKQKYLKIERLVCQQISNINAEKRLKFTKIPANIVLGNSCNFLCQEDNLFINDNITLDYLLGVLNSLLLDWRFKVTNSNNHISNYELAELPIVIPNKQQRISIESMVDKIRTTKDNKYTKELNEKIFDLYDISEKEGQYILNKYQTKYAI